MYSELPFVWCCTAGDNSCPDQAGLSAYEGQSKGMSVGQPCSGPRCQYLRGGGPSETRRPPPERSAVKPPPRLLDTCAGVPESPAWPAQQRPSGKVSRRRVAAGRHIRTVFFHSAARLRFAFSACARKTFAGKKKNAIRWRENLSSICDRGKSISSWEWAPGSHPEAFVCLLSISGDVKVHRCHPRNEEENPHLSTSMTASFSAESST